MDHKFAFSTILIGSTFCFTPALLLAADIALPEGFEDVFNQQQTGIFDLIYGDVSVGSYSVQYDRSSVWLSAPEAIAEQLLAEDMPALVLSRQQLQKRLTGPIKRVSKSGFNDADMVIWINESDATLHLQLPGSLFKAPDGIPDRTFAPYKNRSGFVHSHNLNLLSDSYGDSFSVSGNEALNLTGNSSIRGAWSYSDNIDFTLDEMALYLENDNTRFKAGRQRMGDNFVGSTPSLTYSFFNPVSFDGVSLGYMNDLYLQPGEGASSPVTVYLPQAGTVEIYRSGRLIDIQQFPAGVQQLNTQSWPSGGYDIVLVSKLANGSREEKTQPFYKRSGAFRAGDIEYSIQLGRYDEKVSNIDRKSCTSCVDGEKRYSKGNNHLAGVAMGYTTSSAISLGTGVLLDDDLLYYHSSLDVPLNYWFAERFFTDAILGRDGSYGYQLGMNKSYYNFGFNTSYRVNRYLGKENEYQRYGVVPAYDADYLQFGVSTLLPLNFGLSVNYTMNTLYQSYDKKNKSDYNAWDITLNRDFTLNDYMNLHMDLGFHQGVSTYMSSRGDIRHLDSSRENRFYAQFSLGLREQSYNHYQSLYLRSQLSDAGKEANIYSADYSLDLKNPTFDRGGNYVMTANAINGPDNSKSAAAGLTADNRLGYHALGVSRSFGKGNYQQSYFSERSGFAVGEGDVSFGKLNSNTALIIDATALPKKQYFEVRNKNSASVVVEGGSKTTLSIQPYQKVAPKVEQLYIGGDTKMPEFYNLTTRTTSTWGMPGQVYNVKLTATRNQTITGRLYYRGAPLANARVVGGNTLSDTEGFFVGDFTLDTNDTITTLSVKKEDVSYECPIMDSNVRMTQGVMQIREVECEIK